MSRDLGLGAEGETPPRTARAVLKARALRIIALSTLRLPGSIWRRVGIVAALALVPALFAAAMMTVDLRHPPDVLLFLGRFHPIVVHFPIALLLLGGIMEAIAALYRPFRVLRHSTTVVFFLGSVSAAVAVVAGYLLSLEGGYDRGLVRLHMWLGVSVLIGAIATTLLKVRSQRQRRRGVGPVYVGVLAATMGVVSVTGHIGGSLTHGSGYMTQYLPGGLKRFLGSSGAAAASTRITNVDSAVVYRDLVLPVFEARCTSCHNEDKPKGGLRLGTPEGLLKGGDNGPVIVAGSPEESELLRRITRAPGKEGVMPADGAPPLDVGETELIRWWIANGASFENQVADLGEMPTSVVTLLKRVAPERPEKRGPLYSLEADSVDPKALSAVRKEGYMVREVAADLTLLQATAVNIRAKVGDEGLRQLLPIGDQITWLDLSHTGVGDAGVAVLAKMPNLTRLYLQGTAVGDKGLEQLKGLKHLEYLNLGGTSVTDAGIRQLAALEGLHTVYLWQTKVTSDGAKQLQDAAESLQVILGGSDPMEGPPPTAKN